MSVDEICASCLRDNQEEKAEFWCCDCGEFICHVCGKVHRRFATPHDVVRLNEVSDLKHEVLTECLLHGKQKLVMFCVGHDKLICHECLIKEHGKCKKVMEIEKAAKGVKNGSAFFELKKKMEKTKDIVAKYRKERVHELSDVNDNEQKSLNNMEKLQKDITQKCKEIRGNIVENYHQSREDLNFHTRKIAGVEQKITHNLGRICQLEGGKNEVHIFRALKYLEEILRQSQEELEDIVGIKKQSIDVFPGDLTRQVHAFFDWLNPTKSGVKDLTVPTVFGAAMSQVIAALPDISSATNDTTPIKETENIVSFLLIKKKHVHERWILSLCFANEKQILAIVSYRESFGIFHYFHLIVANFVEDTKNTLSNFDLNLEEVHLNNYDVVSVSMYNDRLAVVVCPRTICVVDIVDRRICRKIQLQLGSRHLMWAKAINSRIFVITIDNGWQWLFPPKICSVDVRGNLTPLFTIQQDLFSQQDLFDIDIYAFNCIFATHFNSNRITKFDLKKDRSWDVYESLDLQNGCLLKCLPWGEILLLEKNSGTIYKLNPDNKIRTELLKDVTKVLHFCVNSTGRLIAVRKENSDEVEIYRAIIMNK